MVKNCDDMLYRFHLTRDKNVTNIPNKCQWREIGESGTRIIYRQLSLSVINNYIWMTYEQQGPLTLLEHKGKYSVLRKPCNVHLVSPLYLGPPC